MGNKKISPKHKQALKEDKSVKIRKTAFKKVLTSVIKKHGNLFKRLAPQDMTYSLQFEDLVLLTQCADLVKEVMNWDNHKTMLWLVTKNLNLGDVSPINMIQVGRGDRVLQYILSAKGENSND